MRGLRTWTTTVAILLSAGVALADGDRPLRAAHSENKRFVLRVEPGQPGRAARSCTATLIDEGERAERRVWERVLVNDAAPTHAAVRDDGRFVVTLDEYRRGGARNAVVIYGSQGELLRHFLLSDLLDKDDWPHVKVSRREVGWLKDARLAFDKLADQFVIELAWGRKVRIDLKTLQVVREGGRDGGAQLAVIPPEVLAQMLGHLDAGDQQAAAEKLADVTQLTPEEQAQAAAIEAQLSADAADHTSAGDTGEPNETASAEAVDSAPKVANEARGPIGPPATEAEATLAGDIVVPAPNPAENVDYVAWLNELGQVNGPDANPVYQEAVANLVPWEGDPDLLHNAARGDLAALASPELTAWLDANAAALAQFRSASLYDAKGWNLQSQDGTLLGVVLPDLSGIRALARGTVIEGRRLAAVGQPDAAMQQYLDVLGAGAHVGNGMTIIENLVGAAMQGPAADALLDLQAEAGPDTLDYATLAGELEAAYRPTRPAAEAVQGERAFFMDAVQRSFTIDPQTGTCQLNSEELNKLFSGGWEADADREAALQDDFSRVGFEETVTEANLYYDTLTDAFARPYPEAKRWLGQIEGVLAGGENINPFLRHLMPALGRYEFMKTRAETTRRATFLVTNLHAYRQQHGEYPASLEALADRDFAVDPFSATPFVYRRSGDEFVLYSVGGNGVDDAGAHDQKGETNDLVFWPRPK